MAPRGRSTNRHRIRVCRRHWPGRSRSTRCCRNPDLPCPNRCTLRAAGHCTVRRRRRTSRWATRACHRWRWRSRSRSMRRSRRRWRPRQRRPRAACRRPAASAPTWTCRAWSRPLTAYSRPSPCRRVPPLPPFTSDIRVVWHMHSCQRGHAVREVHRGCCTCAHRHAGALLLLNPTSCTADCKAPHP